MAGVDALLAELRTDPERQGLRRSALCRCMATHCPIVLSVVLFNHDVESCPAPGDRDRGEAGHRATARLAVQRDTPVSPHAHGAATWAELSPALQDELDRLAYNPRVSATTPPDESHARVLTFAARDSPCGCRRLALRQYLSPQRLTRYWRNGCRAASMSSSPRWRHDSWESMRPPRRRSAGR